MTIHHSSRAVIDERQHAVVDWKPGQDGPGNSVEAVPGVGAMVVEDGAIPSGSEMAYWTTAMAHPDATHPSTMPGTKSTPMPGEKNHATRNAV